MKVTKHKILVWDIETAPGEAYIWSAKTRFVPHQMIKTPPFMLMWSAMWLGDSGVKSDHLSPDEIRRKDDTRIVDSVANLLRKADIVVAHNGDHFDLPWVRGRVWANGLEPLGPVRSIDTRTRSARDFKLLHNNLDALAKLQGIRQKDKMDFQVWVDILNGDEAAMRRMLRYNKRDVRILAEVFESMLPHMVTLPRLVDTHDGMLCPWCGSNDVHKRGIKRTNAYNYQRYQCQNCLRYPSRRLNSGTHRSELTTT